LNYDFSVALLDVPVPDNLPIEAEDAYMAFLEEKAGPAKKRAETAFVVALRKTQELNVYNEWAKRCADFAVKVNPDSYPVSSEEFAQPIHEKDTLASTNFIRALRRGNIVVPMIKLADEGKAIDGESDAN